MNATFQLAIHTADDIPVMKDVGQAVSPGLASYVSMETTTVSVTGGNLITKGSVALKFIKLFVKSEILTIWQK